LVGRPGHEAPTPAVHEPTTTDGAPQRDADLASDANFEDRAPEFADVTVTLTLEDDTQDVRLAEVTFWVLGGTTAFQAGRFPVEGVWFGPTTIDIGSPTTLRIPWTPYVAIEVRCEGCATAWKVIVFLPWKTHFTRADSAFRLKRGAPLSGLVTSHDGFCNAARVHVYTDKYAKRASWTDVPEGLSGMFWRGPQALVEDLLVPLSVPVDRDGHFVVPNLVAGATYQVQARKADQPPSAWTAIKASVGERDEPTLFMPAFGRLLVDLRGASADMPMNVRVRGLDRHHPTIGPENIVFDRVPPGTHVVEVTHVQHGRARRAPLARTEVVIESDVLTTTVIDLSED